MAKQIANAACVLGTINDKYNFLFETPHIIILSIFVFLLKKRKPYQV